MECRVLEKRVCEITQGYSGSHNAVDIVGGGYTLDNVIAHSRGTVIFHQDGLGNMPGSSGNASYGNCIKLDHGNGYQTLYAHMQAGLRVSLGQTVEAGQVLGYMGDSGNAYGGHLHFEVWKDGARINPTEFLNKEFTQAPAPSPSVHHGIGEVVTINGVYVSSDSSDKLVPAIITGTITKVLDGARNPYLLDNGNIGWVNDECIVTGDIEYLSNIGYNGVSIVDALSQIGVDSSYANRARLAELNGIRNYAGAAEQNIWLLELLRAGKLRNN